ncbi:hypothetical protein V6x_28210 [Gimesia chilikensis]|uniref:Uncharacterized protein n=1 Tax=Gimesia chilikensis TaxID=2605989 RepID=A0A517WCX5_9PLAN|nr:hypothetical protein [Gimesia chilikensis]QDU03109.1 hypothetical protein V6x_28210 [Gimesia chilikensis]
MDEQKKYAAYKKGDRVWQFESWTGSQEILERTVEADSGEDRATVKLYEGPANAVSKVIICRYGDVEAANCILGKIQCMFELESDVRCIVRRDFLKAQNRMDLVEEIDFKRKSLSADLERVSNQLSDVWLHMDSWARGEATSLDFVQSACKSILKNQRAPGWK